MKEFDRILDTIKPSDSVFSVEVSTDSWHKGKKLHMERVGTVARFVPQAEANDVIAELVLKHIKEIFDNTLKRNVIDKQYAYNHAANAIREWILRFLKSELRVKEPRSTKLYKFYERQSFQGIIKLDEALLKLYKYGKENEEGVFNNTVHTKNVMNILEILKTKQEKGTL